MGKKHSTLGKQNGRFHSGQAQGESSVCNARSRHSNSSGKEEKSRAGGFTKTSIGSLAIFPLLVTFFST